MTTRLFYVAFAALLVVSCNDNEIIDRSTAPSLSLLRNKIPERINSSNGLVGGQSLPTTLDENFIWGANGHPITQVAYVDNDLNQQIDLLKEHMFSYYRIDVPTDLNGNVIYNSSRFSELLDLASLKEIKILPVIILTGLSDTLNMQEAYERGRMQALGFLSQYAQYFDYYEIGNEEDLKIIIGNPDGSSRSHYDQAKFAIVASYFKGMIDAVKQVDSSAQTIINCGGWLHYGFFDLLNDYSVDYDIVGYHWYSEMGSLLTNRGGGDIIDIVATRTGRNIWITEINKRNGSRSNTEVEQSQIISNYINELDNKTSVKAFFVYELYDEPGFDDGIGYENPNEAHFGIIKWTNIYTDFQYKAVSETFKFKIEESKHGFEDYIYALYHYCNLRMPDGSGLAYWTDKFKTTKNKASLLNEFLPGESYQKFVEEQYIQLHGTSGDANGILHWTNRMRNGLSREDLIIEFCSSEHFWNASGSTNDGFVARVYLKIHGREVDGNGKAYWTNRLNTGTSRNTMVYELLHSEEYIRRFIKAQYLALLGRESDGSGEDYWTNQMLNGVNQQSLIKLFLLGDEYWSRTIIEGYERRLPYIFQKS